MFIRIKKRGSSGDYAYLVENFWINNSSRQKIKNYLGKVYESQKVHDIQVAPNLALDYKELILDMLKNELLRHGFQEKDGVYFLEKVFVNLNIGTIYNSKGKNVVIKLNEGYLCDYYLQELLGFVIEQDEKIKGIKLANLLVSAGLKVKPESFVELYRKLPETEKDIDVEKAKVEVSSSGIDEFGLEASKPLNLDEKKKN